MKVIDLALTISKGELGDKTKVLFKKNDCLAIYHKKDNRFEFANEGCCNNYFYYIDIEELNDEVEIIEEPKEIEKFNNENDIYSIDEKFNDKVLQAINRLNYKLDNVVEAVNELKGAV